MGPGRRFAKPNPFSSLWQVAAGGSSVAPPAITVAVSGLDATITNTGGAADSINWGDGTTNTSLTHTYAYGGVYTATATNGVGSDAATFAANDVPMLLVTQSYNAGGLWQNSGKTVAATADGDPVRVATCPVTGQDYVAPSDSARPLLWEVGDGNWQLSFDGIDDYVACAVSWSGSVGSQATGFIAAATSFTPICSGKAYGGDGDFYQFLGDGYSKNLRNARVTGYTVPTSTDPRIYCQVNGADYRIFVDGVQKGTTASSSFESPDNIQIGRGETALFYTGRAAASIWAKAGWTTTERNNVESFISALNTV